MSKGNWMAVGFDSHDLGRVNARTMEQAERVALDRWGALFCFVEPASAVNVPLLSSNPRSASMSENTNGVATLEAPVTPKAKAAPKPRPAVAKAVKETKAKAEKSQAAAGGFSAATIAKWLGKTCNCRRDGAMTKRQVEVLSALSKSEQGLSVDRIAKKIDTKWAKTVRWAIGNVVHEASDDPFCLKARGCVKEVALDIDGKAEHVYSITATGKKMLKAAEAGK